MTRLIQIIGPSAWLADRKTAAQRSINCYPMLVESEGDDAKMVMESAPGLSLVHTFSHNVRGVYNANGRLFVVSGGKLYEVDDTTVTERASMSFVAPRVAIAHGTTQLAIADDSQLYVYNLVSNTIARISAAGWLGSKVAAHMDGYFIFAQPDEEFFYLSAIDDATDLDALDFSSADSQPDNVVAIQVIRRELYLLGSSSIEVWVNSGGPDFPLTRYQGTPIDVGVVGVYASCNAADSLVWVGKTPRGGPYVYTLEGYTPKRISNQAVEQRLLASTDLAGVSLWTYQDAGGEFVVVNIPGAATSWVWDASTRMWHERGELSAGEWTASRVEMGAAVDGVQYVAGATKLYKMSRDYSTLAGDDLVRERTWPHIVGEDFEPVRHHALEIRCTTGESPEGAITLEISNDGGSVFGPPLRRTLGATGRRVHRVRWMPLGTCPAGGSRVYRLRCSSAVPLTIQGASIT